MGRTQVLGRNGEALAVAYLELMGYTIEARNLKIAGIEVDVVATDGRVRALVEVKLRTRADYGGAALAVNHVKRERLRRAALALGRADALPVRIDVVTIEPQDGGMTLRHYRNAVTEGT